MNYQQRLKNLQSTLPAQTALLISNKLDLLYLTGFEQLTDDEREGFLFLTKESAVLWLGSFCPFVNISGLDTYAEGLIKGFTQRVLPLFEQEQISEVQIDPQSLLLSEYNWFVKQFPKSAKTKQLEKSVVMPFRMIKDDKEIALLRRANALTHQAVDQVLSELEEGQTEKQIEKKIETLLHKQGIEEMAFPTIVAFGPHSALPHHQPSDTKLTKNTAVLIDCGARLEFYCADTTRTVWYGDSPDREFVNIEETVKNAYENTVTLLKNHTRKNQTAADLDKIARDLISEAGYGDKFIHTTGHGVGLAIHEQPSLNINNPTPIQPGMVITIEPGIYLDGKFGYRYENSIVLSENECVEL